MILGAYGISLRVEGTDTACLALLRQRAAALGWIDNGASAADLDYAIVEREDGFDLRCNGETLHSAMDSASIADLFENHAKIALALRAPHHVFVHAGVVAWRGGAIVVPGRSRAGKTTLVEALVRAGAEYYSDEFAVLDERGRVHPYAIPLSIREERGRAATPVDALGGRAGTIPIAVAHIVVTEYREGSRWRPRAVSPAQAMLALMDNTVAARERTPDRTMPVLRRAVEGARTVRSRRGDAHAMAKALLEAIA